METPSGPYLSPETATAEVVGIHPEMRQCTYPHVYPETPVSGRLGTRFVALDTGDIPARADSASKLSAFLGLPSPAAEDHSFRREQLAAGPRRSRRAICRYARVEDDEAPVRGLSRGEPVPHLRKFGPVCAMPANSVCAGRGRQRRYRLEKPESGIAP